MLGKVREKEIGTHSTNGKKLNNNKRCPFRTGDINSSIFINQVRVVFQTGKDDFAENLDDWNGLKWDDDWRRRRRRQSKKFNIREIGGKSISMNSQHNDTATWQGDDPLLKNCIYHQHPLVILLLHPIWSSSSSSNSSGSRSKLHL